MVREPPPPPPPPGCDNNEQDNGVVDIDLGIKAGVNTSNDKSAADDTEFDNELNDDSELSLLCKLFSSIVSFNGLFVGGSFFASKYACVNCPLKLIASSLIKLLLLSVLL